MRKHLTITTDSCNVNKGTVAHVVFTLCTILTAFILYYNIIHLYHNIRTLLMYTSCSDQHIAVNIVHFIDISRKIICDWACKNQPSSRF